MLPEALLCQALRWAGPPAPGGHGGWWTQGHQLYHVSCERVGSQAGTETRRAGARAGGVEGVSQGPEPENCLFREVFAAAQARPPCPPAQLQVWPSSLLRDPWGTEVLRLLHSSAGDPLGTVEVKGRRVSLLRGTMKTGTQGGDQERDHPTCNT